MSAKPPANTDQLHGVIKHLTYVNPENGYFVAKVTVVGKGEKTVTGNTPVINIGEHITASGSWQSSTWGPQFKAIDITLSVPTMVDGIEKYLSSAIQGIGKGYAKKLVQAFGEDVFDVIEKKPELLNDVEGIGPKRAASILAAYKDQQAIREIMVFLHRSGLSAHRAHKVYKEYGNDAIKKIKDNPYILCRTIWGIGFSIADTVASKQGIAHDSEYRIRAGIQHVLYEAKGQGSCGLPVDMVLDKAGALLNVPLAAIERCIQYEIEAKSLVRDVTNGQTCLFTPQIYSAEQSIAEKLLTHSKHVPSRLIADIDQAILEAEVDVGIVLEEAQRDAVRTALCNSICVITGGPGCGKTTITRVILKVIESEHLGASLLCGPTGKSAKRAAEATGHPAMTIHRTLEIGPDGKFLRNKDNPLDAETLIIDEMSMVDVFLMASVCHALSGHTRLILIGDVDQLPSVGAGKVLADIIDSGALPTVRLQTIFRQAASSDIIKNAHAINRGEMPLLGWKEGSDFCFTNISPKDPKNDDDKKNCQLAIEKELLRLTRDMYKLGYDPVRDVQILAPMRRGILGVESLNNKLQEVLNPLPAARLEVFGVKWCTGDKVMQLKNNYDKSVFNGDIGFISVIDQAERTLQVDFDGKIVVYKSTELEELTLAYAFTIHKSQGSEFPVVIMPLDTSHYMMLKRNLLYTGVTRAKKLCVIVGQPRAAGMAVATAQIDDRYSRLKEWLMAGLPAEMCAGGATD